MKLGLSGRVPNHAVLSIASQLAWGGQGFITFVLGGRLLPRKEFGFVVVANAILFGCQCLVLGPVTNPTLRFGAISRKSLYATYITYLVVTGIVCSVFVLAGDPLGRIVSNDRDIIPLIKYLSIPFATVCLYSVQKVVLFARMHFGTVLVMDIAFATANVTGLFLLHLDKLPISAVSFYIVRSCSAVIGLLPAVVLAWRSPGSQVPSEERPFILREYFNHSKYSTVSVFSSYGQSQVDVLGVSHFLSPLSAGVYGAAKVFYTGMTMITSGLIMVILPSSSRVAASGPEGLRNYYRRALLFAYALMTPCGIALAVFANPLLHLLFGERYVAAAPILRIFCIATLILPLSSVTDAVANGAGWFRAACAASVVGGVVGVAASLILPRFFGIAGAALSPIAATAATAVVIAPLTWNALMRHRPSTKAPAYNLEPKPANGDGVA